MLSYQPCDRSNPNNGAKSPMCPKQNVAVAGTRSEDFYFDHDWGFFSAILACYNNHWVLKTSPDDWWNVIVRNIAQAIDSNGKNNKVRDFFINEEVEPVQSESVLVCVSPKDSNKKYIEVQLPGRLDNVNYSWLFDQFSKGIRKNIVIPGYVDIMQADFSTTTQG